MSHFSACSAFQNSMCAAVSGSPGFATTRLFLGADKHESWIVGLWKQGAVLEMNSGSSCMATIEGIGQGLSGIVQAQCRSCSADSRWMLSNEDSDCL